MQSAILIVDDNLGLREAFAAALRATYHVREAATVAEAKAQMEDGEVDVVLLDLHLQRLGQDYAGFEILTWIRHEIIRPVGVIMCTVEENISTVVEAVQRGADGYLSKNCSDAELLLKVQNALKNVRLQRERFVEKYHGEAQPEVLLADSPLMAKIVKQIDRVASRDEPVLLLGEAGTGKELFARRLHEMSERHKNRQPFIAINCAAIPAELAESTLFGHECGAFTSAHRRQPGKLEVAEYGTLFLDEIDCMPMNLQTKLLRVLETRVFERVGGNAPIRLRARLVAAAKADLPEAVKAGKFRADLFYRLNVVTLQLPPLRERPEDIIELAKYFCRRISSKNRLPIEEIEEAAMRVLLAYRWPGNVRELRHEFERMLALAEPEVQRITRDMLSTDILQAVGLAPQKTRRYEPGSCTLRQARMLLEKDMIDEALQFTHNNITQAAARLGLTRRGLQKILKRHGWHIDDSDQ